MLRKKARPTARAIVQPPRTSFLSDPSIICRETILLLPKSRYTHSFTFTIIPKHTPCTQPHESPTSHTKTSKAGICRATTTQAREPCSCTMTSHGSRTRACVQPGCRKHAVTPTARVARLHEAPEAENCNCNCRFDLRREACGVTTDRDHERIRRGGTCDPWVVCQLGLIENT